ncbi:MAG: hypothetical protein ACEPOZ_15200 [Marinifilaceae bacterium]
MDMNKYLIVVFCVLTGCAVVVPYGECEAMNLDTQLLAEWYADHGTTPEENYAIQYVLRQEMPAVPDQVVTTVDLSLNLLENLPSLPEFAVEPGEEWPPVLSTEVLLNTGSFDPYLPDVVCEGLHIRAPDAC